MVTNDAFEFEEIREQEWNLFIKMNNL
jgi:hypothetical protein